MRKTVNRKRWVGEYPHWRDRNIFAEIKEEKRGMLKIKLNWELKRKKTA